MHEGIGSECLPYYKWEWFDGSLTTVSSEGFPRKLPKLMIQFVQELLSTFNGTSASACGMLD